MDDRYALPSCVAVETFGLFYRKQFGEDVEIGGSKTNYIC